MARQGLGHALTIALHGVEGWKALGRIATSATPDRIAEAILRASDAVDAVLE